MSSDAGSGGIRVSNVCEASGQQGFCFVFFDERHDDSVRSARKVCLLWFVALVRLGCIK